MSAHTWIARRAREIADTDGIGLRAAVNQARQEGFDRFLCLEPGPSPRPLLVVIGIAAGDLVEVHRAEPVGGLGRPAALIPARHHPTSPGPAAGPFGAGPAPAAQREEIERLDRDVDEATASGSEAAFGTVPQSLLAEPWWSSRARCGLVWDEMVPRADVAGARRCGACAATRPVVAPAGPGRGLDGFAFCCVCGAGDGAVVGRAYV